MVLTKLGSAKMVNRPKYQVLALRSKVWVRPHGSPDWAIERDEAQMIDKWVTERELGHRASHGRWKLKGQAEVLLFKLHWDNYVE